MTKRSYGAALGELIYLKRKTLGLTQMQLAEDAFGSSGKTRRISELESGTVANPHPKTIDPIIATLKITEAELAECAKTTGYKPDQDLDRAYREARNLIDAVAKQFEHTQPDATLAKLDAFLRAKAKEWLDLRKRIEALEVSKTALSNLKISANRALADGKFDEVDRILFDAEELQQQDRTLEEVRKQSEIRIARADVHLFRGNSARALELYLGAAEFFRAFDEGEMVQCLQDVAGYVYEIGRREFEPQYTVSTALLERALSATFLAQDPKRKSEIHYQLGLVYRNAFEVADPILRSQFLDNAIEHSREALLSLPDSEPSYLANIKGSLGNCLSQKARETSDPELLSEAIQLLRDARSELENSDASHELIATACNNLGSALTKQFESERDGGQMQTLLAAEEAYESAIANSEQGTVPGIWGAAHTNLGALLAIRAMHEELDAEVTAFLRVRAISSFLAAIEIYPVAAFTLQTAETHCNLAQVLCQHGDDMPNGFKEAYLTRAIDSYEMASKFFTKERHPLRWASIQMTLGGIFATHAQMVSPKGARDDFEKATAYFTTAAEIFRSSGDKEMAGFCNIRLKKISELTSEME